MLTTSFAIFATIALLTPGFVIAELSVARSARSSRSDLELALRAVAYALMVHLVFGFWTVHLVLSAVQFRHETTFSRRSGWGRRGGSRRERG